MTQRLYTPLIAALCILAFGLGHVVSSVGVRCRSVSGDVRLELACAKTWAGSCTDQGATGHAGSGDACEEAERAPGGPSSDEPCRDEPIGQPAFVTKLLRAGAVLEMMPAPAVVWAAWGGWLSFAAACDPPARIEMERERPPDSLERLRTVRLVV